MFESKAARRSTLIAAALSTALIAPSLAPAATAQSSNADLPSSSTGSSNDSATSKPSNAAVTIVRNVTVKPGESAKFDLSKIANLGELANIKITAGSDIAQVEDNGLVIELPTSGTSKVRVEATVGRRTVTFDFNVARGDETTVDNNDLIPSPGPGFLVIPDLSSLGSLGLGSSDRLGSLDLGSSDLELPGKCEIALVGLGLPLLALIPLGLASQVALGGAAQFADQIGAQIQNVNSELQRKAGIMNPQLAAQFEAANNSLQQFGLNAGSAALGVAAVGTGAALTAGLLAACLR
ncbi:hypothetical protein [Corynebacterium bouchesdurhonense]|uniref:hypothetical protein n=1 Tax=Corynebacterium bouchesdurhonense TaxID=1720192 RepID=UPI00083244C5|nr:hypothetical protein [Corynebacterium bouchesdurhonense]